MNDADLTKEERKIIESLKPNFFQILVYNGDDELISSVNSEYRFNPSDIIRTDGLIISHNVRGSIPKELGRKARITLETVIRGATYVVIYDTFHKRFDLRIDQPFIIEKENEITQVIKQINDNLEDLLYTMDSMKSSVYQNPITM